MNEALSDCDQAIEYTPGSAEAHNLHGLILDALDRTNEAIEEYREVIRLQPTYIEAIQNLDEAEGESLRSRAS